MKSAGYYAVKVGRRVGIYAQWDEARAQVEKFPGAVHKKFKNIEEAKRYIGGDSAAIAPVSNPLTGELPKGVKSNIVSSSVVPPPVPIAPAAPNPHNMGNSAFMNAFWPSGFSGVHYPSLDIEIYTDGSCLGNNNVAAKKCPAGWGLLAVPLASTASAAEPTRVLFEMFGPVVLDARSPFYLGATVGSNNTGELSAMVEAFLWLQALEDHFGSEASSETAGRVIIRGDSTYAMKSISGEYNGAKNKELIQHARDVLRRLETTRQRRGAPAVQFQHVKGHSSDVFNDRADVLANFGSAGQCCSTGRYAATDNNSNISDRITDEEDSSNKRPRNEL